MHARDREGLAPEVFRSLREQGYAHLQKSFDLECFRSLASEIGHVVAEEPIALRDGAHAYVAKPGPVPLHTDQAQVEIVGWHCQEQDEHDGASLLLDSQVVLGAMHGSDREALRRLRLACPPVAGGPPTMAVPVLRSLRGRELFFCSPWLTPVDEGHCQKATIRRLWRSIKDACAQSLVRVRLAAGDALFVDNQRVLHGRRSIPANSRRRLRRAWVITRETARLE